MEESIVISDGCNKEWWVNGKLHRTDGPAIEYADGHKAWYLNGKLHREDGPAREYSNGTKVWYINGKQHREDGPAVVRVTGTKEWYLNNARLSEEEFTKKVKKKKFTATEVKSLKSYGIEVDI
jgi:hypothetical protein